MEIDDEIDSIAASAKKMVDTAPKNTRLVAEMQRRGLKMEAFETGITTVMFAAVGGILGGLTSQGASLEEAQAWILGTARSEAVAWPSEIPSDTMFFGFACRMIPALVSELRHACRPGTHERVLELLIDMLSSVLLKAGGAQVTSS